MTLSMYQASVPVFIHGLGSLSGLLEKAEAHCTARNIQESVFVQGRLFPDMLPLSVQVFIAADMAKGAAARLAGVDVPSFPDVESTFAELRDRCARTRDFLGGFTAEQIDGSENREILLDARGSTLTFQGQGYLTGFVLPNFYFHITTAYAILRHWGVELSKRDFLGM